MPLVIKYVTKRVNEAIEAEANKKSGGSSNNEANAEWNRLRSKNPQDRKIGY